jgi:hypothetical protein
MRKADLTVELLETRHVRNGSRCCRSAKTVWHRPADAAGLGPSGRLQHPGVKLWHSTQQEDANGGDRRQHALGERRKTRQCNCDLVLRLLREIAVHLNAGVTRGLSTGSNGARTRAAQAAPAKGHRARLTVICGNLYAKATHPPRRCAWRRGYSKEIAPQRQKFAVQNRPEPAAQGEAAINFLPT